MTFRTDLHDGQCMNLTDFGDPLTLLQWHPAVDICVEKYHQLLDGLLLNLAQTSMAPSG